MRLHQFFGIPAEKCSLTFLFYFPARHPRRPRRADCHGNPQSEALLRTTVPQARLRRGGGGRGNLKGENYFADYLDINPKKY